MRKEEVSINGACDSDVKFTQATLQTRVFPRTALSSCVREFCFANSTFPVGRTMNHTEWSSSCCVIACTSRSSLPEDVCIAWCEISWLETPVQGYINCCNLWRHGHDRLHQIRRLLRRTGEATGVLDVCVSSDDGRPHTSAFVNGVCWT